jgi:serine/threonine protein kinase
VAHDLGIVHGCLRASAIFVTIDNNIKILDFELPTSDAKDRVRIAGSPAYLSPEQIRGEYWDRRPDLFAFAAILYEMLAVLSPFQRDSSAKTLQSVLQDNPRSFK